MGVGEGACAGAAAGSEAGARPSSSASMSTTSSSSPPPPAAWSLWGRPRLRDATAATGATGPERAARAGATAAPSQDGNSGAAMPAEAAPADGRGGRGGSTAVAAGSVGDDVVPAACRCVASALESARMRRACGVAGHALIHIPCDVRGRDGAELVHHQGERFDHLGRVGLSARSPPTWVSRRHAHSHCIYAYAIPCGRTGCGWWQGACARWRRHVGRPGCAERSAAPSWRSKCCRGCTGPPSATGSVTTTVVSQAQAQAGDWG
jgi:hypothetical protein